MRNGLVFHGIKPCADVTAARIFAWHSLTSSVPDCDFFRAAPFMADQHMYLCGFLDGAAQNGDCAVGIVIKLAQAHVIFIHLKAGSGSNTRAELVALGSSMVFLYEVYQDYTSSVILNVLLIGRGERLI